MRPRAKLEHYENEFICMGIKINFISKVTLILISIEELQVSFDILSTSYWKQQ